MFLEKTKRESHVLKSNQKTRDAETKIFNDNQILGLSMSFNLAEK